MNARILEQVQGLLVQHQSKFVINKNDQPPEPTWGRIIEENNRKHWYIEKTTLDGELAKRKYDPDSFVNWCIDHGYIIPPDNQKDRHRTKKIRIGEATSRCYDFVFSDQEGFTPVDDVELPF